MRFLKIHREREREKKREDREILKSINLWECGIKNKISEAIKKIEEARGGENWLQKGISKGGKEVEEADG